MQQVILGRAVNLSCLKLEEALTSTVAFNSVMCLQDLFQLTEQDDIVHMLGSNVCQNLSVAHWTSVNHQI